MKLTSTYIIVDRVVRCGSFRKAAEELSLTSTALNRRVIALEEALEIELFDRLPHGVVPTVAGEIFVDHVRKYLADLNRVKATIADLSGIRRGHVSVVTGIQMTGFIPREIDTYRDQHPGVTFAVNFLKMPEVEKALLDHSADIALVLGDLNPRQFQVIHTIKLPVCAIIPASHPLAQKPNLSMADCTEYAIALPARQMGVREAIDFYCRIRNLQFKPVIESNNIGFLMDCVKSQEIMTFLVSPGVFGQPISDGIVVRPLDGKEAPVISLCLAQLQGKVLPVAAAKFATQLALRLAEYFDQVDSQ